MRHVAILIETSRAYGRGLLRGIARYNREHGRWSTYFQPQGLGDPPPPWLAKWQGDGIIARIDNRPLARAVTRSRAPVVNLRGTLGDLTFPFIGSDNEAIARLGAEHLLERGFRHFGFCGFARGYHPGLDRRGDCFQQLIEQAGYACQVLQDPPRKRPRSWEQEQDWLARWIAQLPKPVGIMTANDDRGLQVLDACRRAGAAVPDQVAVLGVDNDEYLCGLSLPPLSSIDINSEETGYQAAALLDRMMDGKRPPKRLAEIAPAGVIVRLLDGRAGHRRHGCHPGGPVHPRARLPPDPRGRGVRPPERLTHLAGAAVRQRPGPDDSSGDSESTNRTGQNAARRNRPADQAHRPAGRLQDRAVPDAGFSPRDRGHASSVPSPVEPGNLAFISLTDTDN